MTRTGRLAVTVALVAAVAAGAAVSSAVPQASAQESCDGVWVVVDAAGAGGPVTTRCAPGSPSSGLAALREAGHEVTLVAGQPFVCRIDGRPADDPCMRYAPADAYWSYWRAEPGGSWAYNSEGAGTRTPPPGSVEGWAFGAGDAPSVPPPSPPADPEPSPDPSPEPEPSPEPAPAPVAPPEPARSPDPEPSSDAPPGTGDADVDDPPDGAGMRDDETAPAEPPGGQVAPAPTDTEPADVVAAPNPDRGSPAWVIAAALLMVAIVTGAFVTRARRRPGTEGAPAW